MPARVVGAVIGRSVRGIVPVSGTLGPIVRAFINAEIAAGIPAIRSVRRFRDSIGPVKYFDYLDQFARQFYEVDFSRRTRELAPTGLPDRGLLLETQFKVPEKYRYRVVVNMQNNYTGEFQDRHMSVYSDTLGSRQEIEIDALTNIAAEFEGRYPLMLDDGWTPIGTRLSLIEHNVGSPY